ncbi:MAG TPA: fused MFS/spermidine synthase [Candidatus Polarisedimenticolaceae bacterium]|nr:fused MFS/spermidine synthase [Candidatus Polarisedimenticolaceae bacterium]
MICLLFAFTGASALVLQVVWTRWLTLALGSSTRATTVVLVAFMGGLGTGSWLGGRLADRWGPRSLRAFAWAELALGGWALFAILFVGRWLPGWAGALARWTGSDALPTPLRMLLALACLAPATVLMGATLPLLARWAVGTAELPGGWVGLLYTVNTFGGAVGVLLSAFLLIDRLGLAAASAWAAGTDLAVGGVCWLLARSGSRGEPLAPQAAAVATSPPPSARTRSMVGAAFFLSGFVGLALEVLTYRILVVIFGSSAYAFAVMLAAFLLGIAGGSLVVAPFADRWRSAATGLAVSLAGLALGVGFTLCMAARLAAGLTASVFPRFDWSFGFEMGAFLTALLPATLALGAVVPQVARALGQEREHLAARFGTGYALNTAGAVVGSMGSALLLLPWLGSARSVLLLSAVCGVGSVLVAAAAVERRRGATIAACIALSAGGIFLGWGRDPVWTALQQQFNDYRFVFRREGPVQTLAVLEREDDQNLHHLRMVANRTSLTGTNLYSQRYMRLLGHLPVLWNPAPRQALVICFGTGMTVGAVATHAELERIDIAEISPEVVEASPLFRDVNGDVLADPRVHLHVEDGRHLLLASRRRWDVITLEPPPPRDSGVVSLYTREFYAACKERLAAGGVVAQWCPLHSQSAPEVQMAVRAFLDAFPHVVGFLAVNRDLILLGSERSLRIEPEQLAERMQPERVRASLETIGFRQPIDLLATALADRERLERWVGTAPGLTDDRPRVEYFVRYGKRPVLPDLQPLLADAAPLELLAEAGGSATAFDRARRALLTSLASGLARERGRTNEADALALQAVELRPADPYYLWSARLSDAQLARLRERALQGEGGHQIWVLLGARYALRELPEQAQDAFRRALALDPHDAEALLRLGTLLSRAGDASEGRRWLERFLEVAPTHPAAADVRRSLLAASAPR